MSSDYDFILDGIRYSYSSLSNYENCPHGFKLGYIDLMSPKRDNFFSDYGRHIHDVLEQYFRGEVDAFALSEYYNKQYAKAVKCFPPPFPVGMGEKYREQGQTFFDFFSFDKSAYDVLEIEATIEFVLDGVKFVAKPDLVLREKATGKNLLFDYKTSTPFTVSRTTGKETPDRKKFEQYYKQMYLYTYALRVHRNLPISEIVLWFPRKDRLVSIPWSVEEEANALVWVVNTLERLKNDNEFKATPSDYFCQNLCGVRDYCKFKR